MSRPNPFLGPPDKPKLYQYMGRGKCFKCGYSVTLYWDKPPECLNCKTKNLKPKGLTNVKAVYKAIAAITKAMGEHGISKGRQNKQQGYAFRGVEDVYKTLNPFLAEHGLVILPRVISRETETVSSKNGGQLFYTRLMVEFDFAAVEDGSIHTVCTVGEAMDSGDKSHNKAMSAAYKYAAFLTFCIPTEGLQEDSEQHTYEVAQKPTKAVANHPSEVEQLQASCREYCEALEVTTAAAIVAFGISDAGKVSELRILQAALKAMLSKVNSGGQLTAAEQILYSKRKVSA